MPTVTANEPDFPARCRLEVRNGRPERTLLAARCALAPKFDPHVKMARGKPACVGPTARLADGMTWEKLGGVTAA